MKYSSNSLCQLFYHGHCLLLSLYICVISLKCNGNADFRLVVVFCLFVCFVLSRPARFQGVVN